LAHEIRPTVPGAATEFHPTRGQRYADTVTADTTTAFVE
jgi:hypothetical protein